MNNIQTLNSKDMPQFSVHTPKSSATLRKQINIEKALGKCKPIGIIGETNDYEYGYNGKYYYVLRGVMGYYLTNTHLSLDEAKQLYNACDWLGYSLDEPKKVTNIVKSARKLKLHGDALFWYFVDQTDNALLPKTNI